MKFSVIIPVYIHNLKRLEALERAINSVRYQTFHDFEVIVVNDGSRVPWEPPKHNWLKVLEQKHQERIIAYNHAFKEAKGEIICLLDSDDMYSPYYLEAVDEMYQKYPEYKMFNFGSIHMHPDYRVNLRGTFKPEVKEVGHEMFGGGRIVNGTFVFKRECLEDKDIFPHTTNPWDFSTMAQEEFPEIKPMFTVDHPDHPEGLVKELGNPWGNDFFLYYKLTRKFHCKPIDIFLYIVYHKGKKKLNLIK